MQQACERGHSGDHPGPHGEHRLLTPRSSAATTTPSANSPARPRCKALPNGGTVAELQGILSDQPQIDRDKGFRDGIAGHNITIVLHQEDNWLRANATTTMQQWLSTGQHIDLVYGQNDEMALGAYNAAAGPERPARSSSSAPTASPFPTGGIRAVELGQLYTTFVYPTCAQQAAEAAEAIVNKRRSRRTPCCRPFR